MFNITLEGETELMARLDSMPAAVREELKLEVTRAAKNLQSHIVNDKLDGQVLGHRSGQLATSIQEEAPLIDGESVYARIYSAGNVKYAAIHEYGFSGSEAVREHVRTVVFGKTVEPFTVGAFTRQMNMPERSFMRSSLADMAGEIGEDLKKAIIRGMKKASA